MTTTSPVWLITGSSSGLGHALAAAALAAGHRVLAASRHPAGLATSLPGCTPVALDPNASAAEIQASVDGALLVHGRIDVLALAAGYVQAGTVEELTDGETLAQFRTNVFGLLNVVRAVLPGMRARRQGTVATFGSMAAFMDAPATALYQASKAAVRALALGLRAELAAFGIVVTDVEPGFFRTRFLNRTRESGIETRLEDYRALNEQMEGLYRERDEKQLGDPRRAAEVLVEVLTGKRGKVPRQVLLGSDAVEVVTGACRQTVEEVEAWKEVAESTDFPVAERFY